MIRTLSVFFLLFAAIQLQAQNTASIEYIENKGQWSAPFLFSAKTGRGDVYLEKNGFTIALADHENHEKLDLYKHGKLKEEPVLKFHAYKMQFLNANANCAITSEKKQKHYYNYFLGSDPTKWASDIYPALAVNYTRLYNGIDLHVYSNEGNIKYDFIVSPKANIADIKIRYDGADNIRVSKNRLYIQTSLGEQIETEPIAYQFIDGEKKIVKCKYVYENGYLSFDTDNSYDPNYILTIDPTLVFCSFTGSTADNWGYTATPGLNGEFYAGGITSGVGYPTSVGAFQVTYSGGGTGGNGYPCDVSISKFTSNGSALLYATYIGGANNEQPHSIIVDNNGNLCIVGRTYSANFPTSNGCYDNSLNGLADAFVTKLSANGNSLIGSTYIGGSNDDIVNYDPGYFSFNSLKYVYGDDSRSEIIVDAGNNVYIAANTNSANFPTTANAFQPNLQGGQDGVVFQLNNNLSTLLWSTYLGGSNEDAAYNLHIDKNASNFLYVSGGTASTNFPTTPGAYHTTFQGGSTDGFICKFNLISKSLIRSTYIGTSAYDQVFGLQDDNNHNIYFMGQTLGNYPVTAGVYSNPGSRQFLACLDSSLSNNIRSTVFGSGASTKPNLVLNAFMVDICGNIYISGWGGKEAGNNLDSNSTMGLPVTANALKPNTDGRDFYFIVFNQNIAPPLLYASFFGQTGSAPNGLGPEHVDGGTSRFDASGTIYQAICANCGNNPKPPFPTSAGSYSPTNPSPNCNLAALKISFDLIAPSAQAIASPNATGCVPLTVNFQNSSLNAQSYIWDFGDGSPTSTLPSPTYTYNTAGTYTATLVAINPNGCLGTTDTTKLVIHVINDTIDLNISVVKLDSCTNLTAGFTNTSTLNGAAVHPWTTFTWNFGDGSPLFTGTNPLTHTYANAGSYNITVTMTDSTACNNPLVVNIPISFNPVFVSTSFNIADSACSGAVITFNNTTQNATTYLWNFDGTTTSTSSTPSFTFSTPGTYTITLIVGNPNSCNLWDTAQDVIKVKPVLSSDYTYQKTDSCGPYAAIFNSTVSFNGTASESLSTSYLWDFGDGSSSTSANPGSHAFPSIGTYTVVLTVSNPYACVSPQTVTKVLTFNNNNISTAFDMPDSVCAPFSWVFNNTTVNPGNFAWSFGDLSNSTQAVPSHTYSVPGTYTINLIVTNPATCNGIDSAQQVLTVFGNPTANFIYSPNPPQANTAVNFTNQSTGATSYSWNFGDGTYSNAENPTHLFNKTSSFNVCLTAINEQGCPDTACRTLEAKVINLVDIPTGLTPNGDNINDYVYVKGFGIESMVLKIFNRWGELVFQTSNINQGWDGKYKGVVQEMDAFAYILDVKFTDGTTQLKKGNITLIR